MSCPLVMLTWVDSCHPVPAWRHLSELRDEIADKACSEMATVGWLLRCDRHVAIIAQSLGSINDETNVQAGGVMTIPRCSVLAIRHLEEGKLATKLGKGYSLKSGKVEKVPVVHSASQRAKNRKPNRRKVKVVRANP